MYKYREGNGGRISILVPTKKGLEEGGLPKGVIVPIGNTYVPGRTKEMAEIVKENGLHTAMVMHLPEDESIVVSIRHPRHYVNRFGFFFSNEDIFANSDEDYDIGNRCVTKKTIEKISDLMEYI